MLRSKGSYINSDTSLIFGRSPNFLFADLENGKIKATSSIENPAKNEKGAGNMAAQFIVDHEVKALISGELGPIAFHILKNAGIKGYKIIPETVENNLKQLKEGKLEEITSLSHGFPKIGKRHQGRMQPTKYR